MNDNRIRIKYLGSISYDDALRLQLAERLNVAKGYSNGTIFLLEHTPTVFTLGRNARTSHLLSSKELLNEMGYSLVRTSRGGDITVHEPGQLVIYYILPLRSKDTSGFIRKLITPVTAVLNDSYGCSVVYDPARPGLWCGEEKLCFTGFDLTGNVSMHGISINICNSLEGFSMIVPCGMNGVRITSLSRILGRTIDLEEVAERIIIACDAFFNMQD